MFSNFSLLMFLLYMLFFVNQAVYISLKVIFLKRLRDFRLACFLEDFRLGKISFNTQAYRINTGKHIHVRECMKGVLKT